MKRSKCDIFKIFMSILVSAAVLAGFVYVLIKGDLERPYITYACVGACFLLSLIFIGKSQKKIFLTLALAATVAGDYFFIFDPTFENSRLIGICVFLGAQFFYLLYSLSLTKAIGLKVIDVALRVALCLLIYFVVTRYVTLTTVELLALMYIANLLVTLISALIHIKTEWLTFLGLFVLLVSNVFAGLVNGGAIILGISGGFLDFITKYNIAFYTYIPSLLLISLSSVWQIKKKS